MIKKNRKHKIIEIGAQDLVCELLKDPETSKPSLISEKIFKFYGEKISENSIRSFIKKIKETQSAIFKTDPHSAQEYKRMVLDYNQELKDILTEVKEMKDYAMENKDMASYSSLVGRIYQAIELFAKLAGDLNQPGQVDVNILMDNISNRIEEENKKNRDILLGKTIDVKAIVRDDDEEQRRKISEIKDEWESEEYV